jgi:hypothetical protein
MKYLGPEVFCFTEFETMGRKAHNYQPLQNILPNHSTFKTRCVRNILKENLEVCSIEVGTAHLWNTVVEILCVMNYVTETPVSSFGN